MKGINRGSAIPAGVHETLGMTALTFGAAAGPWFLGRMNLMADLAEDKTDPRPAKLILSPELHRTIRVKT